MSLNVSTAVAFPTNIPATLVVATDNPTVDNIFVLQDGSTKYYLRQDEKGVYKASWLFNSSAPTDKTSLLNTLLADSRCQTLIIDTAITINSTVNFQGKTIQFDNNGYFTGTGVINNAVIVAGDSQKCFDITVSITSSTSGVGYTSVKWYGAVGSGSVDDQPAIQKMIDTVVANPKMPKDILFMNGETYLINSPIIIYKWNGSSYDFVTVNLINSVDNLFATGLESPVIAPNFLDKFAIGIQKGKSCHIQGLVIKTTVYVHFSSFRAAIETPYATWVSGFGFRDSRYSPFGGIIIDPFTSAVPGDGGYPGLTSWYRGSASGGSSGINVKGCYIGGFTVGIGITVNGSAQNGDCCVFDSNAIEYCKAAYVTCQRQNKGNIIYKGRSWALVHTILDGLSYGQQDGEVPGIVGYDIASPPGDGIIRLANYKARIATTLENIFAEQIYSLGYITADYGVTKVKNSTFNFDVIDTTPYLIPPAHLSGSDVSFSDCVLKYHDDLFDKRLMFDGYGYFFENCTFDLPPVNSYNYVNQRYRSIDFLNCQAYEGKAMLIGYSNLKGYMVGSTFEIIAYGKVDIQDSYQILQNGWLNSFGAKFDFGSLCKTVEFTVDSCSLVVNTTNQTATFTAHYSYQNFAAVGDYVFDKVSGNLLGKISSVNYSTGDIALKYVPIGVTSGTIIPVVSYFDYATDYYIGDVTNGNATISNIVWGGVLVKPYVGQRIKIGGVNLYIITNVDTVANTITINQPATYTKTRDFSPSFSNIPTEETYYASSIFNISANALAQLMPLGLQWTTVKSLVSGTNNLNYTIITAGYINAAGIGKTDQAVWALNYSGNIVQSKSSNFTAENVNNSNYIYFVTGDTTCTLPTAVGNTSVYSIKNTDGGTVVITCQIGTETINTLASINLFPGNSIKIISDGTNYQSIY